jgi:hypothetical protein
MRVFYSTFAFMVGQGMLLSHFVFLHPGNGLWQLSRLTGTFVSESLTLGSIWFPMRSSKQVEPLSGKERLAWTLIGGGTIARSIGEVFWYYSLVVLHWPPFPSWADAGFSLFPPLVLLGLFCLSSSYEPGDLAFILLDSLIVMGSLFGILLPASLTSVVGKSLLTNVLELYYPLSDITLLGGCAFFLLLQARSNVSHVRAQRYGLSWLGIGVTVCALSDFFLHMQQRSGTYIGSIWEGQGWLIGLLIMNIAIALRRFLPDALASQREYQKPHYHPDLSDLAIYVLVGWLLLVFCLNVTSTDSTLFQQRLVLLIGIMVTVGLQMIRQVATVMENYHLVKYLENMEYTVKRLVNSNFEVERQSRLVAQHVVELEQGIAHLKEVLADWANGNLRARSHISSGELLTLASSLNLMADRLLEMTRSDTYLQRLTKALNDVSTVLEKHRSDQPLSLPEAYRQFPEVRRLVLALKIKETAQPPLTHHKASGAGSPIQPVTPSSQHDTAVPTSTPQ